MLFLQALQGLPGYGGSENGIGIGLGLQQLAQARAQAQFSAQQCALASGYLPGNAVAMQHGYQAGNSSGSKQHDMSRAGIAAPLNPNLRSLCPILYAQLCNCARFMHACCIWSRQLSGARQLSVLRSLQALLCMSTQGHTFQFQLLDVDT